MNENHRDGSLAGAGGDMSFLLGLDEDPNVEVTDHLQSNTWGKRRKWSAS